LLIRTIPFINVEKSGRFPRGTEVMQAGVFQFWMLIGRTFRQHIVV